MSTAGISIGDAVLTCLADFSQLKAQVAELNSQVPSLLRPVADATSQIGTKFDDVADAAGDAGKSTAAFGSSAQTAGRQASQATSGTKDTVAELSREIANLSTAIQSLTGKFQTLGTSGSRAVREFSSDTKEARGALALLGEEAGVTLPRELRSFIAELPGFASALSLAFAPAAILTFLSVLSEIPEKIDAAIDYLAQFRDAQKAAFTGQLGDFNSQISVALSLLKQQTLQQREGAKTGVDGTKSQVEALGDFQQQLAKVGALYKAAQQAAEAYGKTATDTQAQVSQIGSGPEGEIPVNFGVDPQQIEKQKEKAEEEFLNAYKALQAYAAQVGQQTKVYLPTPTFNFNASDSSIRDQLQQFHKTITDQITAISNEEQAIELQKGQGVNSIDKDALDRQLATLKSGLDAQLARIEQWKAGVLEAYLAGKVDAADWATAQVLAATRADAAHQNYLANTVKIYQQAGDAALAQQAKEKLQVETAQELAKASQDLSQAEERYHESTLKIVKDFEELQQKDIAKNFREAAQAAQELTQAEQRLGEAQKNLAEAQVTSEFSAEEEAIAQLANLGIITEEQKAQRLVALYEQERQAALNSLNTLLAQEAATIAQAQQKLTAGQNSPFVTDAQITQLQANLDKAKAAYATTEAQIIKTETDSRQKILSTDQSYYGESLNLAIAANNQSLAAELEKSKVQLTEIDTQLALAKATDQNTDAIQRQRTAVLEQIAALEAQAHAQQGIAAATATADQRLAQFLNALQRGASLTKIFNQDVASTSQGMRTFGTVASFVYSEFAQAFQTAIAGAILGQQSFGAALAKATADVAAQVAAQSLIYALFYTAQGIADAFWNPARSAADFKSAAEFYATAAVAAGLAVAVNPGTSSSGSSSSAGSSSSGSESPAQTPQQQPVQTVNVQQLGTGGYTSRKKLVLIGDDPRGGDAEEAVLPLENPAAMQRVGAAIAENVPDVAAARFFASALTGRQPSDVPSNLVPLGSGDVSSAEESTKSNERLFLSALTGRAPESVPSDLLSPSAGGVRDISRATPIIADSTLASIPRPVSARSYQDSSIDAIAERVSAKIGKSPVSIDQSQHHHWNVEGVISDDNLAKVTKKITRNISRGKAKLVSNNTFRITKRG